MLAQPSLSAAFADVGKELEKISRSTGSVEDQDKDGDLPALKRISLPRDVLLLGGDLPTLGLLLRTSSSFLRVSKTPYRPRASDV